MEQFAKNGHLVYVVDDDTAIARLVAVNLQARGYRVRQFDNGPDALASMRSDRPDLIVLDLLMPDIDGLRVTRTIRQISNVPILVLSVLDGPSTKLVALDLGADDYITKPFRVEELLARVRAILRRTSPAAASPWYSPYSYRSGDLLVDLEAMRITRRRRPVKLTPREWAALRVLVNHAGKVVPSASCSRRHGGRTTGMKEITCGPTLPACAGSWSPNHTSLDTSSWSGGLATGWPRPTENGGWGRRPSRFFMPTA